ncbi:hypothetical protein CRG98_017712 [Punica granatum]|uniref:Uncharacterized protein n=1 Tax=Punica granatum TaxID=22663 RepID=A0A2I0K1D2_PUNGR|nr:hypothetical protein CRG98_017712 [Punica granatum]
MAHEIYVKVIRYVTTLYELECGLSSGPACVFLDRAAWECPPSRGCVTDTSENESPLIILRPEGRGLPSSPKPRSSTSERRSSQTDNSPTTRPPNAEARRRIIPPQLDLRTPKLADGHSLGPHPQLSVPRPRDSSPTPTARFFSQDSESPSADFWKLSVRSLSRSSGSPVPLPHDALSSAASNRLPSPHSFRYLANRVHSFFGFAQVAVRPNSGSGPAA